MYMLVFFHSFVVQRSFLLKPAVPFEREEAFPLILHVMGSGIFSRVVFLSLLVVALEVLGVKFDEVWSFLLC